MRTLITLVLFLSLYIPSSELHSSPEKQKVLVIESYHKEMYWDADYPLENEHMDNESSAIQGVRDRLIEAIALRLEADVPVACYLSGGIDSCSILGLASAIQQSPIKAFTISFTDDKFDESHIAKEMAEKTSASQDILKLSGNELYGENYEKAIWHSERTFYNTLGVAKMLMSQHVTENDYKVVITGEGSDEIFGGYAAFKKDMFLYDESYRESEHADAVLKKNQIFSGSILAEQMISHPAFDELMGFTPSWIQPWMMTLDQVKPLLSKEYLEEIVAMCQISRDYNRCLVHFCMLFDTSNFCYYYLFSS